jgi:hypothetical protein
MKMNVLKITIETPEAIDVGSRGVAIAVDVAKLSQGIRNNLFAYGVQQKLADAASGAGMDAIRGQFGADVKTATEEHKAWLKEDAGIAAVKVSTDTLMRKALDALYEGTWAVRTASAGVSEETRVARSVMRAILREKLGAKSPKWAEFTGRSDDEQNAALDRNYLANEAALKPKVEEELARRAAERKAKAGLAQGVVIDL